MQIIDLHCDTILKFHKGQHLRDMEKSHINISKMREGQCLAQCFAIFVPTHDAATKSGVSVSPQEYFDKSYQLFQKELSDNAEAIAPAYTAEEIINNQRLGKMSAILTVEDGVAINGKLEQIERYARLGVRMISLTWNFENCFGYPSSDNPQLNALGLKPFGLEAIRCMNENGIAIDVSHLSEGGFWDVVRTTNKPFVASHSCAKAICGHQRNLTDEQLRALAEKGGVCGVNFMAQFLHPDQQDNRSTLHDVVRHLLHIKNVAGVESLALGSDYDGIHSEMEWGDWSGSQQIVDVMQGYFTDDEIEKICWRNAFRTLKDIIGQ